MAAALAITAGRPRFVCGAIDGRVYTVNVDDSQLGFIDIEVVNHATLSPEDADGAFTTSVAVCPSGKISAACAALVSSGSEVSSDSVSFLYSSKEMAFFGSPEDPPLCAAVVGFGSGKGSDSVSQAVVVPAVTGEVQPRSVLALDSESDGPVVLYPGASYSGPVEWVEVRKLAKEGTSRKCEFGFEGGAVLLVSAHPQEFSAVISSNGGGKTRMLTFNIASGECVRRTPLSADAYGVGAVALAERRVLLLLLGETASSELVLVDGDDVKPVDLKKVQDAVALAAVPDSAAVLVMTRHGSVFWWDPATGEERLVLTVPIAGGDDSDEEEGLGMSFFSMSTTTLSTGDVLVCASKCDGDEEGSKVHFFTITTAGQKADTQPSNSEFEIEGMGLSTICSC